MRSIPISILAYLLFTLISCKKTETPEQPKTTYDPSVIKGIVFLYDEGIGMVQGNGMSVTVENSNPLISTITDSSGRFSLKVDTTLKSFTLVYSKPLYGTSKEYYIRSNDSLYVYESYFSSNQTKRFIEKGNGPTPNLGRRSTVVVNSLQASIINRKITITCNVTGSGAVQVFYQKNRPITSFASIPKTIKNISGNTLVNNGNNVLDIEPNGLLSNPDLGDVHSGDTVYMTAYGIAYFSGNYFDRTTNQFVMPTVNLNNNVNPISFIMP